MYKTLKMIKTLENLTMLAYSTMTKVSLDNLILINFILCKTIN